jgi:hypothetical protein
MKAKYKLRVISDVYFCQVEAIVNVQKNEILPSCLCSYSKWEVNHVRFCCVLPLRFVVRFCNDFEELAVTFIVRDRICISEVHVIVS